MKVSASIKFRLDPIHKARLQSIADRESLQLSDIVRRAIREYLQRQTEPPSAGSESHRTTSYHALNEPTDHQNQ